MFLRFPCWVSDEKCLTLTVPLIYMDSDSSGEPQVFVLQFDEEHEDEYDLLSTVLYQRKNYDRCEGMTQVRHFTDWFDFKSYTQRLLELENNLPETQRKELASCFFMDRIEISDFEIIEEDN